MYKILVVEDDEVARMVLLKILADSGEFEAVIAENGKQALEQLSVNEDIAAILLDRNMPEMNGMEVLQNLKANPSWARIPVIFQTAADSDAQVIEGKLAGAYYYLKKPYEPTLVCTLLRSAIDEYLG